MYNVFNRNNRLKATYPTIEEARAALAKFGKYGYIQYFQESIDEFEASTDGADLAAAVDASAAFGNPEDPLMYPSAKAKAENAVNNVIKRLDSAKDEATKLLALIKGRSDAACVLEDEEHIFILTTITGWLEDRDDTAALKLTYPFVRGVLHGMIMATRPTSDAANELRFIYKWYVVRASILIPSVGQLIYTA